MANPPSSASVEAKRATIIRRVLDSIRQIDPRDQWAFINLAKSYARRNHFDSARLVYETMLLAAPGDSMMRSLALNGLACCDLRVVQREFTTSNMPERGREYVVRWGPRQEVRRGDTRYTRRHPYRGQPKSQRPRWNYPTH